MSLHFQRGFNLIEALIALVVLTLGLLGIAAMQLTAMRNTQGSYYRSQATALASDMAERIHANSINFASYVFNPPSTPTNCAATAPAATPLAAADIYDVACGPNGATSQLAGGSLQAYCINAALSAEAACNSETNMRMQINIGWNEVDPNVASGVTSQAFNMVIQP